MSQLVNLNNVERQMSSHNGKLWNLPVVILNKFNLATVVARNTKPQSGLVEIFSVFFFDTTRWFRDSDKLGDGYCITTLVILLL